MAVLTNFILLFTNPQKPNSQSQCLYEGRPYQIFGFDVLIDSNLKAWLLEINTSPNMELINCRQQTVCAHAKCPRSPVDHYVKKQVLFDAVSLMLQESQPMEDSQPLAERFRSLSRVYPSQVPMNADLYFKIKDLRRLFMKVTQGKLEMSEHQFVNCFSNS